MNQTVLNDDNGVIQENLAPLIQMAASTRLYLVAKVPDEDAGKAILAQMENLKAFDQGLAKHRVIFCSTTEGKVAIIRQLSPGIHIETDAELAKQMQGKVPNIICVKSNNSDLTNGVCNLSTAIEAIKSILVT
ncbi:Peroxisome biogenesis protein 22 [Babesia duncani]|nr:Peroxisome biogenesis protein 22 [Babesia duncani]